MFFKKFTDGACGGSQGDENDGEAADECESGGQELRTGGFAVAKLVHADAGEHGDVTGDEGKHARGEKGDEPSEKGSSE
jgi:hypothetical protein